MKLFFNYSIQRELVTNTVWSPSSRQESSHKSFSEPVTIPGVAANAFVPR